VPFLGKMGPWANEFFFFQILGPYQGLVIKNSNCPESAPIMPPIYWF